MFLVKHKHSKQWLKYSCVILISLVLSSCVSTKRINNTLTFSNSPTSNSSSALYNNTPDCVMLMPVKGHAANSAVLILEDITKRHFAGLFKKFIPGSTRRVEARRGSFNLDVPIERRRFSKAVNCNYGLNVGIKNLEQTYLITWASRNITLKMDLVRLSDETILWTGTHSAQRSQGGIPTGPLSLVLDTRSAGLFVTNQDGFEALIEDVVRQLTKTFPLIG